MHNKENERIKIVVQLISIKANKITEQNTVVETICSIWLYYASGTKQYD
jgi:hypothetical protein